MPQRVTISVNRTSETTDKEILQSCYMTLFKACATCIIIGWEGLIQWMKGNLDL